MSKIYAMEIPGGGARIELKPYPGKDASLVELVFLVDQMALGAAPEADPMMTALRMADEVISRLKAEAFNRQLRGETRDDHE